MVEMTTEQTKALALARARIKANAPPDYENMDWSEVASRSVENTPQSAEKFAKAMWQMVSSPVETGQTLLDVANGAISLVTGHNPKDEKLARAVGDMFAERYTTVAGFKKALAEDSVGVATDVLSALSMGAGSLSKLPVIGKAAGKISNAASMLDPVALPFHAFGKALNPNTSKDVKLLMNEGVTPTPGQIMGGAAGRVEEKLGSVPLLGDIMNSGRRDAQAQLNTAAYNRALNPIGQDAAGVALGAEGIAHVRNALDDAYSALMPNLRLTPDMDLLSDIELAIKNAAELGMSDDAVRTLNKIVQGKIASKIIKDKRFVELDGEALKILQTDLRKAKARFSSASGSEGAIADALSDIDIAVINSLKKSNPSHAEALNNIDTGYANYVRLRRAGSSATATGSEGFSPNVLDAAVKASDTSVGKGATATGTALMGDLSQAGREVLGSKVPNSATAERTMLGLAGAGGIGAVSPVALGVGAGMSLPYLPGMRKLSAELMTGMHGKTAPAGRMIGKYAPNLSRGMYQSGRLHNELMRNR